MQFNDTKTMGICPNCGKAIPLRDKRDRNPAYCSRVCRGLARYSMRYKGSMSGPADAPADINTKAKWNGANNG